MTDFLEKILEEFPVVVLTGARQTGKSTLVQHLSAKTQRLYKTLDDLDVLEMTERSPETLVRDGLPLILDEVQRAPKLLQVIKREVDRDRQPGRFLLTGSANLLLMKKVSESLAGRAIYLVLHAMTESEKKRMSPTNVWNDLTQAETIAELRERLLSHKVTAEFSWTPAALEGGYPPVVLMKSAESRKLWMDGYVRTYLERDIQQLSEISALTDFRRLMRVASLRIGGLLNQADLARDAGIKPTTAQRYLNLLEMSYQIERLPAYAINRTKRLIKSPKLYWGDTGFCCHLAGITEERQILDASVPTWGGFLLENWILRQMDVWREITVSRPTLYYWRTTSGAEVDFVIETGSRLIPIEIKSAAKISFNDTASLKEFLEDYGKNTPYGILVYGGKEIVRLEERILAVPVAYLAN